MKDYIKFVESKAHLPAGHGFKPNSMPDFLFDFQAMLLDWAIRQGRAAIFADCGLGKTPIELVWADNVVRKTNKNVLIVAPLSVCGQTVREGEKFGIEVRRSNDGKAHRGIIITNYEKLHHFDTNDYIGVACDESSVLKNFEGARQELVTEFMRKTPYRLLCTATAAPNDYIELGTSAEALGDLGRMDMLSTFFKNDENSMHPIWWGARWRFKHHAELSFWRWVCSWARAIRKPSDYGFSDGPFILPKLMETEHFVAGDRVLKGTFFAEPAVTLEAQRAERRDTIQDRCEKAVELVTKSKSGISWCHLNEEGDLLERLYPKGSVVQVSGSDDDDFKEEAFLAFSSGQIPYLVTKPKIAAFGMNWQCCNHMSFFPSHSFEQYYQAVRRCWRFGQKLPVQVDLITTAGEMGVLRNLQRKNEAADKMFVQLIAQMQEALRMPKFEKRPLKEKVPSWL